MKLKKIDIILDNIVVDFKGKKFFPVILTFRNFWGFEKKITVYPTENAYYSRIGGYFLYCRYIDELGNEIEYQYTYDDLSEQISNFCLNYVAQHPEWIEKRYPCKQGFINLDDKKS